MRPVWLIKFAQRKDLLHRLTCEASDGKKGMDLFADAAWPWKLMTALCKRHKSQSLSRKNSFGFRITSFWMLLKFWYYFHLKHTIIS